MQSDALETHQRTAHPAPSDSTYMPPPALPPLPPLPILGAYDPAGSYDFTSSTDDEPLAPPGVSLIDLITGRGYEPTDSEREVDVGRPLRAEAQQDAVKKARKRRFACPFPDVLDIGIQLPPSPVVSRASSSALPSPTTAAEDDEGPCPFRFSRIYDVERHLRSRHRVEVERGELEKWFEVEGGTDSESEDGEADEEESKGE